MSPDLLDLERQVCVCVWGGGGGWGVGEEDEEGSGVMPMCTRLVPAAAQPGVEPNQIAPRHHRFLLGLLGY